METAKAALVESGFGDDSREMKSQTALEMLIMGAKMRAHAQKCMPHGGVSWRARACAGWRMRARTGRLVSGTC